MISLLTQMKNLKIYKWLLILALSATLFVLSSCHKDICPGFCSNDPGIEVIDF